jgi:hypothetical protein
MALNYLTTRDRGLPGGSWRLPFLSRTALTTNDTGGWTSKGAICGNIGSHGPGAGT